MTIFLQSQGKHQCYTVCITFPLTPTFAVRELCKLTLSLLLPMQKLTALSRVLNSLSGLFSGVTCGITQVIRIFHYITK